MTVKLTFNGREIRPGDIGKTVMDQVMDQVKEKIPELARKQLESIRCPVHGRTPHVTVAGSDRLAVSGFCCERLRSEIERHLH